MIEIFATEFIKQLVKGAVEEVRSTVSEKRKRRISEEEDRIKMDREVFDHKRSKVDLPRFSAAPGARLSHLTFEGDRAFPSQC
jgi:U3 small nucleolar ribonucleoprotein component